MRRLALCGLLLCGLRAAEEPDSVSLTPAEQTELQKLQIEADAAQQELRAVSAERELIRLQACLRGKVSQDQCGALMQKNGTAYVQKIKPTEAVPDKEKH